MECFQGKESLFTWLYTMVWFYALKSSDETRFQIANQGINRLTMIFSYLLEHMSLSGNIFWSLKCSVSFRIAALRPLLSSVPLSIENISWRSGPLKGDFFVRQLQNQMRLQAVLHFCIQIIFEQPLIPSWSKSSWIHRKVKRSFKTTCSKWCRQVHMILLKLISSICFR